jgi:hypothetical protein
LSPPRAIPEAARHNSEGLRRRGFPAADIAAIKRAYRTLYRSRLALNEALEQIAAESEQVPALGLLAIPGKPRRGDHKVMAASVMAPEKTPQLRSRSASSPAKRPATRWARRLIEAVRQRIPGVRFAGTVRAWKARVRDLAPDVEACAARLFRKY